MIQSFLYYIANNRGYSENTIKAYREDLQAYARWAKARKSDARWSTQNRSDFEGYAASLIEEGKAPATVARKISALRQFYNRMKAIGAIECNPVRFCSSPKIAQRQPETLTMKEVRAYLSIRPTTAKRATIQAIVALITGTGMRIQEVLDLRCEDIDKERRSITVHGKGSKERTVFYDDTVKAYMNTYAQAAHITNGKLFPWERIATQRDVRKEMANEMRPYIGWKHVSPHRLRHTYAIECLNNGMDIKTLSASMGHESVKTTERYTHVLEQKLQAEYKRYNPFSN